ncbi:molybdenum cofactor biosynthesis protein MoeA [Platysternon megacephalum]|uniref:Molybdenum cofactor biosynthesis protein MoeA n=1 Tax=Platysternon megacephalum TaxID=55544 RepID=A0A4D9DEK1_9SAUR|nr:molybdenum cofactor biosynthesis protein MoeA [Platysternon megacephalum]
MYLARLRACPELLSTDTLQRVLRILGSCQEDTGTLRACISHALDQFVQEPRCVQENARLLIRWGGGELEFVSGQGQCEISVLLADGEPQYHITELGGDRPVTWSHANPEPLSVTDLAKVWDRLGRWGALGEELSGCFGEAISQFSREPPCVQGNARLRLCWDGGSLEFVSGKGQYEISVSYQEGNPRYRFHVETLPGHLYVARLRSRKNPLSAESLFKFHTELGLSRGDTAALRACLYTAWERFSQEPRCVQENARLLIRWDGGELEFIAGQGQCEICVSCSTGEPQYHITEKTWDVFVAWTNSHPEPLSINNLERVRDRLGRWGALGEELSGCFGEAISQFSREPPCVQGNARVRLCWDGGSLEFLSGKGQYEISVSYQEGNPRYHFHVETLPGHLYVARLRSRRDPLTADSLVKFYTELGLCRGDTAVLRACFNRAWEGFGREPRCVQENARLLIRWDGGELEFIAGQGQCEICVSCSAGKPQYHITKKNWDMFVSWTNSHPEPLSINNLERVKTRLGRWGALGEKLSGCFGEAISQFSREPPCVQGNARLRLSWDSGSLEFVSGKGQYEISVSYQEGNPRYHFHVETLPGHLYVARLRSHRDPLSADTLLRFHTDLGLCRGDTAALRTLLQKAWQGFHQEPRCVQGNARLLIRRDGQDLEFVSGQGQCEISVLLADGEPQYHITELGGDRPETWSHASPEPLSVTDLERVRDRLGRWGALGEELSGCFGEAISQFSREPPCVQGNARMGIQWGRGRLEFLSGEGQCEISVRYRNRRAQYEENTRLLIQWGRRKLEFLSGEGEFELSVYYRDGNPQYEIGELPVHKYLARLHARPDLPSANTLQRVREKLGSCKEDRDDLRACFHHAWEGFCWEPPFVQENARLLIRWGGEKLEFVSGWGENLITMCKGGEGRIQYMVQVSGWWPRIPRLLP